MKFMLIIMMFFSASLLASDSGDPRWSVSEVSGVFKFSSVPGAGYSHEISTIKLEIIDNKLQVKIVTSTASAAFFFNSRLAQKNLSFVVSGAGRVLFKSIAIPESLDEIEHLSRTLSETLGTQDKWSYRFQRQFAKAITKCCATSTLLISENEVQERSCISQIEFNTLPTRVIFRLEIRGENKGQEFAQYLRANNYDRLISNMVFSSGGNAALLLTHFSHQNIDESFIDLVDGFEKLSRAQKNSLKDSLAECRDRVRDDVASLPSTTADGARIGWSVHMEDRGPPRVPTVSVYGSNGLIHIPVHPPAASSSTMAPPSFTAVAGAHGHTYMASSGGISLVSPNEIGRGAPPTTSSTTGENFSAGSSLPSAIPSVFEGFSDSVLQEIYSMILHRSFNEANTQQPVTLRDNSYQPLGDGDAKPFEGHCCGVCLRTLVLDSSADFIAEDMITKEEIILVGCDNRHIICARCFGDFKESGAQIGNCFYCRQDLSKKDEQ